MDCNSLLSFNCLLTVSWFNKSVHYLHLAFSCKCLEVIYSNAGSVL